MIGSLALVAFVIGYHYYDVPRILNATRGQGINDIYPSTRLLTDPLVPWVGRTMSFAVLSLSQLFHSFNMRSEHSLSEVGIFGNRKLVMSFLICGFLQIAVISFPPLAVLFQVVPLHYRQWAIVLLLSMTPIVVVELQKNLNSRLTSK